MFACILLKLLWLAHRAFCTGLKLGELYHANLCCTPTANPFDSTDLSESAELQSPKKCGRLEAVMHHQNVKNPSNHYIIIHSVA